MRFTSLILLLFALSFSNVRAQFFVPKATQDNMGAEAYVVTMEGDTVYGKLSSSNWMTDKIKSFKLKTESGKIKYNVENAKLLAVKIWTDFEEDSGDISIRDLRRSLDSNFNKVVITDWIIFERIQLPKKKEKYAFVQLLNPGFDSKIKIYRRDNTGQTMNFEVQGMQVAGGDDNSHLIVLSPGTKSIVFKKRKYKDTAAQTLFNNCDLIERISNNDDLKWKNFAEHVFIYDQQCK